MVIKDTLNKLVGKYYRIATTYSYVFDPLFFQKRYARRTLSDKRRTISFEKLPHAKRKLITQFWGGQNPWFDFYYTIGDKDNCHLYFPDNWFYIYIDAKLNDWRTCKVIDDKSMYDIYFADILCPRTIARCCNGTWLNEKYEIIDREKVLNLCYDSGKVIIKPSVSSSGGHGIEFWKRGNNDLSGLLGLHYFKNCVIQEIIEQHADLSSLHPHSVNTIRIMTILIDNNVIILSSVLRMGVGKANVDNVSSGGVACGIDGNGCLRQKSYNAKGQCWDGHPDGYTLKGVKVPYFEECCIICKRIAPRFTRFANLVSWDFAIDKMGRPVLIEANLHGGELDFHQMCNGPIFGDELTTKKMIERFCK